MLKINVQWLSHSKSVTFLSDDVTPCQEAAVMTESRVRVWSVRQIAHGTINDTELLALSDE